MRKKPITSLRGFTFVELMLVVAIVMLLAGLSSPFYSRFLTQNAVTNAADDLTGSLRKAQIYSMTGKQNGPWGVRVSGTTITLFQGTSYASRNSAFDETWSESTAVSMSGMTEVVFARVTGIPSATPTVTILGNNTTETLVMNSAGVVNR